MANATGLATDKKKMNGGARSDLTPGDSLLRPLFLRLVLLFHYTPFTITWCGSLYFFLLFRPEYAPCVSPAVARSVLVAYGVWILTDPSPRHGGFFLLSASSSRRLRNYCRDARIYKWMAEYFSLTLVKSCDLDPSRRYLFVVHPHGFLSTGCVLSLVTEGAGFRAAFPGIERVCCTIAATFTTPFYREWMLACGVVTVDRATIVRQLTRGGERRSVVLVPGGAAEAMHAHPGVFRLVLRHRKGFVRVALQTGCSLVPTLVFGENELVPTFYVADGGGTTWLRRALFRWQTLLKERCGFVAPFALNPFPRRARLTTVTGTPLHTDGAACGAGGVPSEETVDRFHARYCQELRRVYDAHKARYGVDGVELEIV